MKFFEILLENRVDEFKSKYSTKFSKEQLERITDNVLTKYLDWVGKYFDAINFNSNFQSLVQYLREFDKISSNLPLTDINSYKSINELYEALKNYAEKPKREYQKVQGGNVVYDDGRFFVVNPQTYEASCYYGKGTKWCTAADSNHSFQQYNSDGKLFYILDKTLSSENPNYKIALLKKFDNEEIFYDAKDEQTKILRAIWGEEIYDKILQAIQNYMQQEYSEQLKIFANKESARKERERLERLRIQRIMLLRQEEAEERRLDGEWDLGPDCPPEGLKAHALLNWLESNLDVSTRTKEQSNQLTILKNKLDELNSLDEPTEEQQDEINEIESQIENMEDTIDVYNIVPVGEYYECVEFQVLDAGLENRRYAVGDEDEIQRSCYERVDNLIDEIGFNGFSPSFARSFIDTDRVVDYAQDVYEDDVSNNSDVYFDDNERMLSEKQKEQIEINKRKIFQSEKIIENLEEQMYEGDEEKDEEIQEKIDELNELISELEDEISDIEDDPDGDFPDDLIEEKVEELVDNVRSDPESFMDEFGLNWEDYIDKDEFIEGVIDADGYGHTLNSYDGNADEVEIQGITFYVMRID